MGSITSYARAKGEQLGYNAKTGLAERPDRLVAILVTVVLRRRAGPADPLRDRAVVVAVASTITVLQRILLVRRQAVARAADTESASAPDPT